MSPPFRCAMSSLLGKTLVLPPPLIYCIHGVDTMGDGGPVPWREWRACRLRSRIDETMVFRSYCWRGLNCWDSERIDEKCLDSRVTAAAAAAGAISDGFQEIDCILHCWGFWPEKGGIGLTPVIFVVRSSF